MSCCSGCDYGQGCNGLGSLGGPDPYVMAGSVVSWRGSIQKQPNGGWTDSVDATDLYVKPKLEAALVAAGFPGAIIEQQGFFDHENTITVVTGIDYGALNHVAQVIEGAIYSLGYYPVRKRYELITTPALPNDSYVVQPGQQSGGADVITRAEQARRDKAAGGSFNFCETFPLLCPDPDEESFLDKLARLLGVKPSEAAVIGAIGAVALIVVVKKAL